MRDVREAIRDSRPDAEAVGPVDVDRLLRRADRQRTATRAAGLVAAFVLVAAGFAVVQTVRPSGTVYLEGADDPGGAAPATVGGGADSSPSEPDETEAPPDTERADFDDAIDRLIAANRSAPPRPVADDPGEVLVERTYAIWGTTTVGAGEATHTLEATWYEVRTSADGGTEIVREAIGEIEPTADLAQLRRQAEPLFASGPPEETTPTVGDPTHDLAAAALREAERDATGSVEPAPGRTERPDQPHAFMRAADALRMGLQPEDRIRALEVIRRIDPRFVEYRGSVKDLLGREGIGIAGKDGEGWGTTTWNVLIFDPETGDLLGDYVEWVDDETLGVPPVTSYTSRVTEVLDTTG